MRVSKQMEESLMKNVSGDISPLKAIRLFEDFRANFLSERGETSNCLKLSQIVSNWPKLSEKKGNAHDGPTSHCPKLSQNCRKWS